MAVQSMRIQFGPPAKKRPQIGDRKTAKDGTVLVRRQCYIRWGNQWCGQVQNGRPVAEWVPEGTPMPWDQPVR